MIIKPQGNYIVVRVETTGGMIVMLDGKEHPDQKIYIHAVGPGVLIDRQRIPPDVKVGDQVSLNPTVAGYVFDDPDRDKDLEAIKLFKTAERNLQRVVYPATAVMAILEIEPKIEKVK